MILKQRGSAVIVIVIILAGIICMISFYIALGVSISNASLLQSNKSFQAQQYAITRCEVIAATRYDDIVWADIRKISGELTEDYYEEVLVNEKHDNSRKEITVNIYKTVASAPLASMKIIRNKQDVRLDSYSEELATAESPVHYENKTLSQKDVVENFAKLEDTVKDLGDVGNSTNPVFYDDDGQLKLIKYAWEHIESASDELVVWDDDKLNYMRKEDIPSLISDVKIAVPGYIIFSNGVVFAWGNYNYVHDNLNEACAVTVKKPCAFKTLICQIQDSMERDTRQPFSMYRFGWASDHTTDTTETFAATGGKNLTVFWIGKRI